MVSRRGSKGAGAQTEGIKRRGPYSLMDIHWYSLMDIHQWISLMDIHRWYSLMDIHQWISMDIQFFELQFFEIQFFGIQFHDKQWKTLKKHAFSIFRRYSAVSTLQVQDFTCEAIFSKVWLQSQLMWGLACSATNAFNLLQSCSEQHAAYCAPKGHRPFGPMAISNRGVLGGCVEFGTWIRCVFVLE